MTIVVTGGGSGGHITPILAVASELKKLRPDIRLVYIGQRGDNLADIAADHLSIDAVFSVRAGKFRRYHQAGLKQLLDLPTIYKNIRDGLWVLIGIWQSWRLLRTLQPRIVFSRGGYVSVPVAVGARLSGIPYITHDSDAIPSLANRLIAKHARLHAVALPEDVYPYPRHKTVTVGIPIDARYRPLTPETSRRYRAELGVSGFGQLLLVTGGGNGAEQLNRLMVSNARYLLAHHPDLAIMHIAGRALQTSTRQAYSKVLTKQQAGRVIVKGFVTDLYRYSGAADVIIARGGATNFAEFAAQAKACLVIPPPQLIWAVKNTELLAKEQAIIMLSEDQAEQEQRLATLVGELLDDQPRRLALSRKLAEFARPNAAKHLATLLLEEADRPGATA